jgi:Fe-S cluster assembly protein SufD
MVLNQDVVPHVNAFRSRCVQAEPRWLSARREAAIQRFSELGFPTRKQESWRFTDLHPLTARPILPLRGGSGVHPFRLPSSYSGGKVHRIVLIDGRYSKELSNIGKLPDGAFLCSTAEALRKRPEAVQASFDQSDEPGAQPFSSLNMALFDDGFVLALEPGVRLDHPVELVHFGTASGAFHLRNLIQAGPGSSATVIETAEGVGAGWTNSVTTAAIGAGAAIHHVKIQNEATEAIHFSLVRGAVAKLARYETFLLTLGARLSRQDIQVSAAGEAAKIAINGAYLLRGDQEATFAPFVSHLAQGCQTAETVKGVVQDRAHGVFLGKMTVEPGADGTDAHQLNQNLLLSSTASIDTKPELEIFADEVKCSHGATVGDLDESALFYLQARGIHEGAARTMLMEAFAASVIEAAGLGEELEAHLHRYVRKWLGAESAP